VKRAGAVLAQAGQFIWLEALSCLFPGCVFLGLALAKVLPLPIPRYDALLVYFLVLTFGFWALRLETWREVLVIFAFHLVGLGLEMFKVHTGAWNYRMPLSLSFVLIGAFLWAAENAGTFLGAWRYPDQTSV